jgi:hypothetical protein
MTGPIDSSAAILAFSEARELQTEIEISEAWYGANAYSTFLRKHRRRPKPEEAAAIGRLLGGRVKADDGTMQPPISLIDKQILRDIRSRRKRAARRYQHILRLKAAIAALAENNEDPAGIIGEGSCLLDGPEITEQLDIALCWLNRFAEEWHGRPEKTRTSGP